VVLAWCLIVWVILGKLVGVIVSSLLLASMLPVDNDVHRDDRHFHFPELAVPDPQSTIKTMIINGRKIWMDVQAVEPGKSS
jgi:hypothetical protein